ncbi:MAG TPA: glycogen debranching enzyme N-terminal domain-containing protein, partial [Nitrospira sp.]|nr:glycogen debranching enzyme N-terminal domain-containing protein [Nitrospira sp.]
MTIDSRHCQDLDAALNLEWLETNGRGGYASGTVAGANTRRYHALLLIARHPPVDRVVLVNHVEEFVESGGRTFPLSTNLYHDAVHPEGYQHLTLFTRGLFP